MIKILVLALFVSSAFAYVPTVESLFRFGSNPEVTVNGVSVTLAVKRLEAESKPGSSVTDASLLGSQRTEDYYKIFFTKSNETLKVAQSRYDNASFSESSLLHKIYYPNFTSYTIKADLESAEKGIFYGLIQCLALNDSENLINYLKSLGVPVRLNSEIINKEKVDFLAEYKKYLMLISKDRNARKTEVNPMYPTDHAARERAQSIMAEPMYLDTKQVQLQRDNNQMAWVVNAGPFEAVVSYKMRDLQRIRFKSAAGDFEVIFKDYWLANGTHAMPRYMLIKTFNGEQYQVEVTNLRHYNEKEDDLIKRLRNWDQILKGKESTEPRPEFLL